MFLGDKMEGDYIPPMYRPKRMEDRGDNAAMILKFDGGYLPIYFIEPGDMHNITDEAEVVFLGINEKFFDGFVCKVADRLNSEIDN